jgi:hypothetical protein
MLVAGGCGDDEGATAPVPTSILGTWVVTSIIVEGNDLAQLGMGLSFHFSNDGEYSFLVTEDRLGICDVGPFCEDFGDFSVTDSQIVFDPAEDPKPFTYTVAGNVMTLTGVMNGIPVVLTLERG